MSNIKINGNNLIHTQYPKNDVEIFAYGYLKPHKVNLNDKVVEVFFREISTEKQENQWLIRIPKLGIYIVQLQNTGVEK